MEPPSPSTFMLDRRGHRAGGGQPTPTPRKTRRKNDLRNKAAALGASLVTIDESIGETMPLQDKTKVKLAGRAYKSVD